MVCATASHLNFWQHRPLSIRSYANRATKRFADGDRRRLPAEHATKIAKLLQLVEHSQSPADLRDAGCRVHRLRGDRKGFSAIEVSGELRIVFRFEGGNA